MTIYGCPRPGGSPQQPRYPDGVPFYRDQVVPRLIALTCGAKAMRGLRDQTATGLYGRVVEIGFGSGYNLPHYPVEVERVLAVEPSATAWRMASRRISAAPMPVEQIGLDGQSIPLDDASCDAALCTFTLCTIPDPVAALGELHRVLRPGAPFHLLEHGLAPDARVAAFQRRVEPLQRRVADGCHLTRDPVALVGDAGFTVVDLDQKYGAGPKAWTYLTLAATVRD
jgi:SAM-dependent methyltransferase